MTILYEMGNADRCPFAKKKKNHSQCTVMNLFHLKIWQDYFPVNKQIYAISFELNREDGGYEIRVILDLMGPSLL